MIDWGVLSTAGPFEVVSDNLVGAWAWGQFYGQFSLMSRDGDAFSSVFDELVCSWAWRVVLSEVAAGAGSDLYLAAPGLVVLLVCSGARSDAFIVGYS